MKIPRRFLSLAAALILLPFTYGGCVIVYSSGGHKDRDEDDDKLALISAPAAIDAQNAVAFAAGAVAGGPQSNAQSNSAADENLAPDIENAFRTMKLPVAFAAAMAQIGADPAAVSFSRTNLIEASGIGVGSCGGQLDFAVVFNQASGAVNGFLEFEAYCVDNIVISNRAEIDGIFDNATGDILSAGFEFENLSVEGLAYSGNLEVDIFQDTLHAYLSIDTGGTLPGEVFTLSSYYVDVIRYPAHDAVWVSGTYIHPEFGAVELDTTEPFVIHAGDQWPSSGLAVVTGSGETSAALTAVDFTRFRVAADTTGSGQFTHYLGMHDWDSPPG